MNTTADLTQILRLPFSQWDRLRNPYAGWARIGLFLLLPVAVWSHDLLLLLLLALAVIGHGYWFPSYVSAEDDEPAMTRLMDRWQAWLEDSLPATKALTLLPGAALALPLLYFLWEHNGFWSVYFFSFAVIYKTLFGYILLNNPKADKVLHQDKTEGTKTDQPRTKKAKSSMAATRNPKTARKKREKKEEEE